MILNYQQYKIKEKIAANYLLILIHKIVPNFVLPHLKK